MKKRISKIFGSKNTLQRKVITYFILLAIVPIVTITSISSLLFFQTIEKESRALIEQNVSQHEIVVKERMKAYENVLYELVTNKEYIELGKKINNDEKSLIIDIAHMETLLRQAVYTYDGIRSITFLADKGNYATYSKWYGSVNENIWSNNDMRIEVYQAIERLQELTFIATINLSKVVGKEDYVILMGYPVKNLRTKEQSGVLVIALETDVLIFDTNNQKNEIITVIVDNEEKIVAGVESQYINMEYEEYLKKNDLRNNKISVYRHKISNKEWVIINIVNTFSYRKNIYRVIGIVYLFMFFISCLFFWVVYLFSSKYFETIKTIAVGIQKYNGDEMGVLQVDIDEKDDLYIIVKQYNYMTERVNGLVGDLKKKNIQIKNAINSQKHAEIKVLEAQINPHFLFNTLDSINWRAIEHEEEEISNMLGALGSLLRYSVSNIEMQVILQAEMEWLKKYIFLQRDRFQHSFDCFYDITEEASDFPIYKMLLQPIIENVILHGFAETKSDGLIKVSAHVTIDDMLEMHILDNGCGIQKDVLDFIHDEIKSNSVLNGNSIGISNVIHRLKIYYGDRAKIFVRSKVGEGTEFIFLIPRN
ncbi:MAG: sensor histidine kinase [Lachnospiraceae bacterium]